MIEYLSVVNELIEGCLSNKRDIAHRLVLKDFLEEYLSFTGEHIDNIVNFDEDKEIESILNVESPFNLSVEVNVRYLSIHFPYILTNRNWENLIETLRDRIILHIEDKEIRLPPHG